MKAATKYYSLLVRLDGRWSIHFGDYDRQVVAEEQADVLDSSGDKAITKIITTGPDQASIDKRVADMNAVLGGK